MEFISLHKWTAVMFGGGLLTVPLLKDLPEETGLVGLLLVAIGAWRQIVEVQHAKAEARRKQELHEETMKLLRKDGVSEKDLNVLKELLGQ